MKMPTTATLNELSALYDVFFIDQFGVLRGGEAAYAGASQALARLKAQGKTIVILSNSGRSGSYNISRLAQLGFDSSSFDHFVTSGDVALALLGSGLLPIERSKSTRSLTIASGEDRSLADKLGFSSVDTAEDADLVIISGSRNRTYPTCGLSRPPAPRGKKGRAMHLYQPRCSQTCGRNASSRRRSHCRAI